MARPLLTDKKMVPAGITVHPDEWAAFVALMQSRGTTASARVRRYVQAELKKAAERGA